MKPVRCMSTPRVRNRGVVLPIGLILLLVMTLVMVVAMSGSILQERMAGALRNESMADAGVDSGLREGEQWLWRWIASHTSELDAGDTAFAFDAQSVANSTTLNNFRGATGWVAGGREFGASGTGIDYPDTDYYRMVNKPAFVVESLGDFGSASGSGACVESHCGPQGYGVEQLFYYRVTSRSSGGTAGVIRAAESTFSISMWTP